MSKCILSKAIHKKCVEKVKHLLESGQYSPDGNGLERYPPIILCLVDILYDDDDDDEDETGGRDNTNDTNEQEDISRCEILKTLVHHGVNLNVESEDNYSSCSGMTPVMFAARQGYLRCLQFLTNSGANLDMTNDDEETVIHLAVRYSRVECVKYLANHVAPSLLNQKDSTGWTVLMQAAISSEEESILCLQHLIAAGADLEVSDEEGKTALMHAICFRNEAAVNFLLEKGSLVNTVIDEGETPFTLAFHEACFGNVIIKLLHYGADPSLSRRYPDCLHKMVSDGENAVVQALVRSGMPPLDLLHEPVVGPVYVHTDQDMADECRNKVEFYLETTPVSPLTLALLYNRSNIARYLIFNRFFTNSDIVRVCWDPEISGPLQAVEAKASLEIIDFLSRRPQSLLNLSLVTVSSALSRDWVCSPPSTSPLQMDKSAWVFKPTFRERVTCLKLPRPLQRLLLHETQSSSICSQSWSEICLGEGES